MKPSSSSQFTSIKGMLNYRDLPSLFLLLVPLQEMIRYTMDGTVRFSRRFLHCFTNTTSVHFEGAMFFPSPAPNWAPRYQHVVCGPGIGSAYNRWRYLVECYYRVILMGRTEKATHEQLLEATTTTSNHKWLFWRIVVGLNAALCPPAPSQATIAMIDHLKACPLEPCTITIRYKIFRVLPRQVLAAACYRPHLAVVSLAPFRILSFQFVNFDNCRSAR